MRFILHKQWYCLSFLLLLSPIASIADTDVVEKAISGQVKTEQAAKQSQQKIDKLDDQTSQMLAEYRSVLRQIDSLKAYNDQLDKLVNSQQNELSSIKQQLQNIETTQRDIVPLMLNMVDVLEQFVALDIPFLPEERQNRITQLKTLMERADVTLAEKYRRVLEAYQVETEYGRTIESYQGELKLNNELFTVDFLRVGRVSLYYLTLDGQQAGYWDNGWKLLDSSYRKDIEKALKIAKKQLPPDLLVLPTNTSGVTR